MGLYADLQAKILADREAGRDIPPVIEELALMIANSFDPQKEPDDAPEFEPEPASQEHSPSNV